MTSFSWPGLKQGDRVVAAMSGGVDSSAVAAILKTQGFDVIGVTLQLYDHGQMIGKKGACCAGRDIHDARRVCDTLNIPHYVLDYENIFHRDVMTPFAESYRKGETPIPCIQCNQTVKFRDLLSFSRELDAKALITGHYIQRKEGPDGPEMHRAVDFKRDQSYFLFGTTFDQLSFCHFPLGGMPDKSWTREIAAQHNLPVAKKPDSQDICFVVSSSYHDTIQKIQPDAPTSQGNIVHINGTVLGTHQGITHYTVGQRKGLGVAWREPLYVVRLDPQTCNVIVGPRSALACQEVHLRDVTWTLPTPPEHQTLHVQVKLRSTQEPLPATVHITQTQALVQLHQPEHGISAGQACVFYDNNRILGGGWIQRTPHPQQADRAS